MNLFLDQALNSPLSTFDKRANNSQFNISHFTMSTLNSPFCPDLQDHLQTLKQRGLLQVVDRPIDKDSELHPLVRWQFVGGMDERERKAF
ncbi:MAG: hypothetical protein EB072_19585, partial [Betaproteobacteria bacterium]|nr:hypothetical protein [Betaproteobacteria bacterium]